MTPKQLKLLQLLIDNYGRKGQAKPLGTLIIEAGYSPQSAHNPQIVITKEMKEAIQPIIDKMEKVRTQAIDNITEEKLQVSSARDNAAIADILTKNIQLLSGGDTARISVKQEDVDLANKLLQDAE